MTALTVRRWAGALTLPLMFLFLLAATALDPLTDDGSNATQVRQAADHLSAIRPLAVFELLAALAAIGVVATLAGAVRSRGAGWANAGGLIGAPGVVGMALIAVRHLTLYALVRDDRPHAVSVLDALNHAAPWVVPLFFAMPLALVLLGVGAFRAGLAGRPVVVLLVLFLVAELVPGLPGGELIALLLGLVAYGWLAVRLLRPAAVPDRAAEAAYALARA